MDDLDDVSREYDRVRAFARFDASQRIWWICMRNAVERWFEKRRDNAEDLRTACRAVADLPERMPDEADHWHRFCSAVGELLERNQAAECDV